MLAYGCLEKYMKKLVGRTDIEDALGRLDQLTQDEVRMAAAQGLKATHEVDNKVQAIDDKVQQVTDDMDDQKRSWLYHLTSLTTIVRSLP
jgi:uncharacterized protein YhaN